MDRGQVKSLGGGVGVKRKVTFTSREAVDRVGEAEDRAQENAGLRGMGCEVSACDKRPSF